MKKFNIFIHKLFLGKLKKLRIQLNKIINKNRLLKYSVLFISLFTSYITLIGGILGGISVGIVFLVIFTDFFIDLVSILLILVNRIRQISESIRKNLLVQGFYYYKKYLYKKLSPITEFFRATYDSAVVVLLFILLTLIISENYILELSHPTGLIENIIAGNINFGKPILTWLYLALVILLLRYFKVLISLITSKFVIRTTFFCIFGLIYFIHYVGIESNKSLEFVLSISFTLLLLLIPLKQIRSFSPDIIKYFELYYRESHGIKKEFLKMTKEYFEEKNPTGNIASLSDNPIKHKSDDIFGYKGIAYSIYKLIRGINPNDGSYSIGVIGEWGLGKSSVIGILEESSLNLDSNIMVYKFNPWNYNKNDLIERFIADISSKINIKSISKDLSRYLESLSGINNITGITYKFLKLFQEQESIDELRIKISNKLHALGKKLVIIVDDLDRCEPDEIILMLNIIKNIGSFSNIIYIVSFDKIHVIEALERKGFNKDYVEKIINTEIHLPIPPKETKAEFFRNEFDKILLEVKLAEVIRAEACKKIIESGMTGLDEIFEKENLRFIKKLLNKLNVHLKLVFNDNQNGLSALSSDDITNIVLINYIKIKDLELFNDSTRKRNLMNREVFKYKTPNRPSLYLNLKERRLNELFLNKIVGLQVGYGQDDELQIHNQNTLTDVPDLASKVVMLKHNWKLLLDFS